MERSPCEILTATPTCFFFQKEAYLVGIQQREELWMTEQPVSRVVHHGVPCLRVAARCRCRSGRRSLMWRWSRAVHHCTYGGTQLLFCLTRTRYCLNTAMAKSVHEIGLSSNSTVCDWYRHALGLTIANRWYRHKIPLYHVSFSIFAIPSSPPVADAVGRSLFRSFDSAGFSRQVSRTELVTWLLASDDGGSSGLLGFLITLLMLWYLRTISLWVVLVRQLAADNPSQLIYAHISHRLREVGRNEHKGRNTWQRHHHEPNSIFRILTIAGKRLRKRLSWDIQ